MQSSGEECSSCPLGSSQFNEDRQLCDWMRAGVEVGVGTLGGFFKESDAQAKF